MPLNAKLSPRLECEAKLCIYEAEETCTSSLAREAKPVGKSNSVCEAKQAHKAYLVSGVKPEHKDQLEGKTKFQPTREVS